MAATDPASVVEHGVWIRPPATGAPPPAAAGPLRARLSDNLPASSVGRSCGAPRRPWRVKTRSAVPACQLLLHSPGGTGFRPDFPFRVCSAVQTATLRSKGRIQTLDLRLMVRLVVPPWFFCAPIIVIAGPWGMGRVTLCGDAAHPLRPTTGECLPAAAHTTARTRLLPAARRSLWPCVAPPPSCCHVDAPTRGHVFCVDPVIDSL